MYSSAHARGAEWRPRTGESSEDLLVLLFRRAAVVVSIVALCASPALARRTGSTPPPEENVSRSQPHSPAAPIETVAPRPNLPGNVNPEDPPACLTPPPARGNAVSRVEAVRSNVPEPTRQPTSPDPSTERRERAKPSVSHPQRIAPRHTPQKQQRMTSRPLPATPGMGALIRMGMTVGREISFLDESAPSRSTRPRSGRAPPAVVVTRQSLASPAARNTLANHFPPRFAHPALTDTHMHSQAHAHGAPGSALACFAGAASPNAIALGGCPAC
ncbi:MAG: hypothetical protein U0704_17090 [Candidatus Eisenbacteria bacterium]